MAFLGKAVHLVEEVVTGEIFTEKSGTPAEVERFFRHGSFSKVREKCFVKWYVDGKNYFHAVSEALMNATEEIFIEDWWLSPELYLRRPPCKNEEYRLDRILKKKAEAGVKVYVVLFKEVKQALTLDSEHSKEVLQTLHPNILVQRHPDHGLDGGTFFWAPSLAGWTCASDVMTRVLTNSRIFPKFPNTIQYGLDRIILTLGLRILLMVGKPALDVARHFIQRWNFVKKAKAENLPAYPVLIAKSDVQYERERPTTIRRYASTGRVVEVHPESGTCSVQILRSSSAWSHGLPETEHSIQNAYIHTIQNAQHFIYIENQFFITATKESDDYPVKNLIGKAIVDRIMKAYRNDEKFRIIVAMPLLPAFPAELDTAEAGTVRLVIHYQYQSICRGGHSIIEELEKAGCKDPHKYIGFFALRKYDKIDHRAVEKGLGVLEDERRAPSLVENADSDPIVAESQYSVDPTGTYVTEELYIHTKLLIADDKIVIIGSANLNDRSQLGDHDSEIAAIIEDKEYLNSRLADKQWEAGKFAATLRRAIFKEHLGLENEFDHEQLTPISHPPPIDAGYHKPGEADKIVTDPASDEFYYNFWLHTAKSNTEIFRNVFHCVPEDSVTNWDEYKAFVPDRTKIPIGHVCETAREDMERTKRELSKIKGHLVEFPLNFMKNKKLSG
ncbi:5973_t:CDS:10, partial [Acaulospora colombiana]